jgi:hypothetical protein
MKNDRNMRADLQRTEREQRGRPLPLSESAFSLMNHLGNGVVLLFVLILSDLQDGTVQYHTATHYDLTSLGIGGPSGDSGWDVVGYLTATLSCCCYAAVVAITIERSTTDCHW